MHLLRSLLFSRPSFTLDLIHRKALRTSSNSNVPVSNGHHHLTTSRFALSNTHYRVYLLWKGALYLYNGLLVIRFSLLSCAMFLDLKCESFLTLRTSLIDDYSRLDPVIGGLIELEDHKSFFHFLNLQNCFVAVILSSISLYLDLLLHFRLDLFTTQLFQEVVNLNGVHFFAINRHLKKPPKFCLANPVESSRVIIKWARQLWNFRSDLHFCSFYFRRLRKYPHLSRAVRLKTILVVMAAEKVAVVSMYSTLIICCGLASAYLLFQFTEPTVVDDHSVEDLKDFDKNMPDSNSFLLPFVYNRSMMTLPPLATFLDVLLLAYTAFNASQSFNYLLFYFSNALFANIAHQAENQRKLQQLVAHCRRTTVVSGSISTDSISNNDNNLQNFRFNSEGERTVSGEEVMRVSRISSTLNSISTTSRTRNTTIISPSVPSTNGLLYSQNLAACLVFYYQERLFFLYTCLRLNGLAKDQEKRKGSGPVSSFLSACFTGSVALGAAILTPLFSGWYNDKEVSWSRKIFLLSFFALQSAFFWSAVAVCSFASGWLHRSGRLLYSAQSILRPRANVVTVVAKLKLMTRFELVHTRRPFTFQMFWRSVGVRRVLVYEYLLLFTVYLFALFKLINKRQRNLVFSINKDV